MSVPQPILLDLHSPLAQACDLSSDLSIPTARATAPSAAASEQMVLEHLASVRFIARKLHQGLPRHVQLDDLISAGMIGLLEACNRFDARRHVQFKSYAQFRIRGAILDWLRTLDWGPRELRRKARAIAEATRTLTQQLGRAPGEQEIADAMGMELEELQQLSGELRSLELGSLNAEHTRDENDEELEFVPASAEEDPLFLFLAGESRQHLIDAIEELPEKERLVLTLYYYEELTMREIGATLGVVESRVSQIHSSAVRRLRGSLSAVRTQPAGTGDRTRVPDANTPVTPPPDPQKNFNDALKSSHRLPIRAHEEVLMEHVVTPPAPAAASPLTDVVLEATAGSTQIEHCGAGTQEHCSQDILAGREQEIQPHQRRVPELRDGTQLREHRILAIREAIETGEYRVSAGDLADALLRAARRAN